MRAQRGFCFFFSAIFFIVLSVGSGSYSHARAAGIAVINMQQVLKRSKVGKSAQHTLEKKIKELQASFKKDEDALKALQKEIEKKSSAWNDEIKQEKAIEFQRKRRDLRVKQEDANLEMKRLREQQLTPIWKVLEQVVADVAKEKGYSVVLPRASVLFVANDVDITANIIKALDEEKQ